MREQSIKLNQSQNNGSVIAVTAQAIYAYIAKRMVENISCTREIIQKIAPISSLESMKVIISAMEKPCPICLKNDYDLLKLRRHLREHQHEELVEYIIKNMGDRTVRPSGDDSADISATFT